MRRRYTFTLEFSIDSASDVNGRDDERLIADTLKRCAKDIQRGVWVMKDRHPEQGWVSQSWDLKEMET